MRGRPALLLAALLALAAAASLTLLNVSRWSVNATLPPAQKAANTSLYPLLQWSYRYVDGVNYTTYVVKAMPNWPEQYVIGQLAARDPGWQGQLAAVFRAGSGQYAISLAGNVQVTQSQDSGPYTPLTAPIRLTAVTQQGLSVLARAVYRNGGISAWQWLNVTVRPMQRLASWTFSCSPSSLADPFNYCRAVNYGWDQGLWPYSQYTTSGTVQVSTATGSPAPSLYLTARGSTSYLAADLRQPTPGYAINVTTRSRIFIQYYASQAQQATGAALEFLVRGFDGIYIKLILYRGQAPSDVFTADPGSVQSVDLGGLTTGSWQTFFDGQLFQYVGAGWVLKVAFVAYSAGNNRAISIYFDNLYMDNCTLPPYISTRYSGYQYTWAYLDQQESPTAPPSLAEEVDSVSSTQPGYVVAIYNVTRRLGMQIPAAGTAISVSALYSRTAYLDNPFIDTQNNVAFVAVGVDTDGDGRVDVEYIYYRADLALGYTISVVSSFISPGTVICTTSTPSACPNTAQYRFIYLGTMSTDNVYTWNVNLGDTPGAVVAIALGAVDGGYNWDGTGGDFWVFWDNLSIAYSACPPPQGWGWSGYVWQSYNYLLVTAGGSAQAPAVQGGLTYIANFTGVGRYYATASPQFGVYWRGQGGGCIFGLSPPPPAARWVELRPLQGYGDVIVRDQLGNVLRRGGCLLQSPAAAVAFAAGPGELLKVYSLEAWG